MQLTAARVVSPAQCRSGMCIWLAVRNAQIWDCSFEYGNLWPNPLAAFD
jgi:hypothetical protein